MRNRNLSGHRDVAFSNRNFQKIASFAIDNYGIHVPSNKKDLLHARVARRMRALGVAEFDDYLDRISARGDSLESEEFISILTTNTTSFYRERHHFNLLANVIVPNLFNVNPNRRVRIWSAGCSFGHEAYSIAAALNVKKLGSGESSICVVASDIDSEALRRCDKAEYSVQDLDGLSPIEVQSLGRVRSNGFEILSKNRKIVDFQKINLVGDIGGLGKFDVIFCRNVMIYFSKETRKKVWDKFLQLLSPRGYLILGHSERLIGPVAEKFETVGVTAYRRLTQV